MLLHITPRLFSVYKVVDLLDLEIEPLGIRLVGGKDLATRRPFRNKLYSVACRKQGQKAINGILIETASPIDEFRYVARWAVEASLVVTHKVDYRIVDRDFDAASDYMILWHGCREELGGWSNRSAGAQRQPAMEVKLLSGKWIENRRDIYDCQTGLIMERNESLAMPTIERERILSCMVGDRLPSIGAAFRL
jgi:hypothetical protein